MILSRLRIDLGVSDGPLAVDLLANGGGGAVQMRVAGDELIQEGERHVELPHAAERTGEAAHPATALPIRSGARRLDHREDLSEPPGCDARSVKRLGVVVERSGQVAVQHGQALAQCLLEAARAGDGRKSGLCSHVQASNATIEHCTPSGTTSSGGRAAASDGAP